MIVTTNSATWETFSRKVTGHEQKSWAGVHYRAGGGPLGIPILFQHEQRQVPRGSLCGFPGKNVLPDRAGGHGRACLAQRAIERVRLDRIGGYRYDAVRAFQSDECKVVGDEIERRIQE